MTGVHWYFGELITRASPNSAGMRWQVYFNGRFYRADTLAGIKQVIKHGRTS